MPHLFNKLHKCTYLKDAAEVFWCFQGESKGTSERMGWKALFPKVTTFKSKQPSRSKEKIMKL